MSKQAHLLLPIIHVMFDEQDGAPVAVVFITPDFRITMPEEDYKKYEYIVPDTTPPKPVSRMLTLEEKIQEQANKLRTPIDEPPLAVERAERHEQIQLFEVEVHPLVAEAMSMVAGLELQREDPLAAHGILLNDQAGPDGSDLTDAQWKKLVELIMYPVTKDESRTSKGQSLIRAKSNAYQRIRGLPLALLQRHIQDTPKPLRMQLALYQCARLGSGSKGEGSNWIPNSYAAYIEADEKWEDRERQAIYDHAVDFREPREPRVKDPQLAQAMADENYDFQSDIMTLEQQFSLSNTITPKG